ncbi:MAG: FG-GAP-like repeat-containing protein [Cyclobacteriaceae bacterium]
MKNIFIFLLAAFALVTINVNAQQPGELWGVTYYGGAYSYGVLFKTDPDGSNQVVKYNFDGISGSYPFSNPIQASNGKLYGMAYGGGAYGFGVIYEYDLTTGTYSVDYNFDNTNGGYPYGSLTQGANGKLYGMTYGGGAYGWGIIFEYDPSAATFTKKYDFNNANGAYPLGNLTLGSNGILYGMAEIGGAYNYGVIFEYDPATNTVTKDHDFDYTNGGYASAFNELTMATNGKLYGTTYTGGANGVGVFFEFDPSTKTFIKDFDFNSSISGSNPYSTPIQSSNGKLFGTAVNGLAWNLGAIYSFDPSSNTVAAVGAFSGANGSYPLGGLVQGTNGKLYGMTQSGGAAGGYGVLFEFDPDSLVYTKKLDFNYSNGAFPQFGHLIVLQPQSAPAAPVTTAATSISQNSFTANWNTVSGASNYLLDVAIDSTFSPPTSYVFSNLSVASNSSPVTGLQSGMSYYYRVRASNSFGLSAYSNNIKVTTLLPANTLDSLALVDMYNNLVGGNWINQGNWFHGPISTWYGVTVDSTGRVIGIDLRGNRLRGAIPSSFTNLTALQTLRLQNNSITQLPSGFASMTSLNFINIRGNNLNFDALAPFISMTGINYNPQNNFGSTLSANLIVGGIVYLTDPYDGSSNVYQWKKDTVAVVGATTSSYQFSSSATAANAGVYVLSVTSPLVPGLTINSNPITVNIIPIPPASATTYLLWPGKDGVSNDIPANTVGSYWGDFDNDGDEDILLNNFSNPSSSAELYQNNNNGTFTRLTNANLPTTSGVNYAWADTDNDGYLDIFSSEGWSGSNARSGIFKNNGNKTFQPVAGDTTYLGGSLADYDNDGLIDFVPTTNDLSTPLLQNQGNNRFKLIPNVFNDASAWVVVWADIDGDNDQDILFGGDDNGRSGLYRNDGYGTFTFLNSNTVNTDSEIDAVEGACWADIDNDMDLDLFILGQKCRFYFNDGHGNFTAVSDSLVLGGVKIYGQGSTFGDIDNDGDQDLFINDKTQGTILFLNNGNGTFSQVSASQQSFIPVIYPGYTTVSLADYNNDGFLDLFAPSWSNEQSSLFIQE